MWSVRIYPTSGASTRARSTRTVLAGIIGSLLGGVLVVAAPGSVAAAPSSGFNDWSCQPSASHPDPVVMLHGIGANGPANFAGFLGPTSRAGYRVFAPTYGQVSMAPPTHGTDLDGLVTFGNLLGLSEPLRQAVCAFGCPACDDLPWAAPRSRR